MAGVEGFVAVDRVGDAREAECAHERRRDARGDRATQQPREIRARRRGCRPGLPRARQRRDEEGGDDRVHEDHALGTEALFVERGLRLYLVEDDDVPQKDDVEQLAFAERGLRDERDAASRVNDEQPDDAGGIEREKKVKPHAARHLDAGKQWRFHRHRYFDEAAVAHFGVFGDELDHAEINNPADHKARGEDFGPAARARLVLHGCDACGEHCNGDCDAEPVDDPRALLDCDAVPVRVLPMLPGLDDRRADF